MVEILVYLAVLVIVIAVAYWLLGRLTLDPMIRNIINIVFVVVVAVVAIVILLQLTGVGGPSLRLR
jgi:hypothetical protein